MLQVYTVFGLPDRRRDRALLTAVRWPSRRPGDDRFFRAPLGHSLPKPSFSGPYQTSISVIHDRHAILDCSTFSGRNAGSYKALTAGRPLRCLQNGRYGTGNHTRGAVRPQRRTRAMNPGQRCYALLLLYRNRHVHIGDKPSISAWAQKRCKLTDSVAGKGDVKWGT